MKEITEKLKKEILEIGNKVALGWGASCFDFQVYPRKKEVVFLCKEHGEEFTTSISYADMKRLYDFDMDEKYRGYKAKKFEVLESVSLDSSLKEKLMEIGDDVASTWGAECYDVELAINEDNEKVVRFICNECGEDFYTDLTYEAIKEEYAYDVELKKDIA